MCILLAKKADQVPFFGMRSIMSNETQQYLPSLNHSFSNCDQCFFWWFCSNSRQTLLESHIWGFQMGFKLCEEGRQVNIQPSLKPLEPTKTYCDTCDGALSSLKTMTVTRVPTPFFPTALSECASHTGSILRSWFFYPSHETLEKARLSVLVGPVFNLAAVFHPPLQYPDVSELLNVILVQ